MNTDLSQRMGRAIRLLRHEAQFSQEELAARCNLHRTYIGSVERGEKNITIETADKLARALRISLPHLFECVERQEGSPS